MRRFLAIARTAVLETLAEPLSAVLFLSGFAEVHLAPAFHYHQFGEPGRLARECGLSVLLVFGLAAAAASAIRSMVRELGNGTAAATLALAVPRSLFFAAKTAGIVAVLAVFASAAACATALSHSSSVAAAILVARYGGVAQAWGPGVASGAGFTISALALAAAANRFLRVRFCVAACLMLALAQPVALAVAAWMGGNLPPHPGFFADAASLAPAFAALTVWCAAMTALAAAVAVRFGQTAAISVTSLAAISSFLFPVKAILPDANMFWLADALANGGSLTWCDVAPAVAAGLLVALFWTAAGAALLEGKELQ